MKIYLAFFVCKFLLLLQFCVLCRANSKYFLPNIEFERDGSHSEENTSEFWKTSAQNQLRAQLQREINDNTAKNVIFFMGDGMSIASITAARIYQGQLKGQRGEEEQLSFEKFPYVGLSKTYCIDGQIADSSCAATALFSGINGNFLTTGVNGQVQFNDCRAASQKTNHVETFLSWAHKAGKRTGLVTTTRITHASPAAAYAHSANRNFECDADVLNLAPDAAHCRDIASQMVLDAPGKNVNVIFGGGRVKFVPKEERGDDGEYGERLDERNLISEWQQQHERGVYVHNKTGLDNIDYNSTEHILGLFTPNHMSYALDADREKEPSLRELTEAAIKLLSKEPLGYFLFVEGGRIDHAHHGNLARKALEETVQFSDAVQAAVNMTNERDTLIVVTSDHSHTMSIAGYSKRGNDILGLASDKLGSDGLPYTTLTYANGPGSGSELLFDTDGTRVDLSTNTFDKNYRYAGIVPIKDSTHAGEDVGVFARGPQSHLFTGVYHQNAIPDMMAFASCVGSGITICNENSIL